MLLLGTLQAHAQQIQRALLNGRGNRNFVESRDLRVLGLVAADVDGR